MSKLKVPTKYESAVPFMADWTLYHVSDSDRDSVLWLRFKLMLPPDTKKGWGTRRKFTLHWNPWEARFAKNKDRFDLERAHPELFALVLTHLDMTYDRAWLLRHLTLDDIKAECIRLAEARAKSPRARALAMARAAAVMDEGHDVPVMGEEQ